MPEAALDESNLSRSPPFARLARTGVGLLVLAVASTLLNNRSLQVSGVSLIWLPNAFLIGTLLCAPRRQWSAFVLVGYAVDLSLNLALGTPPATSAFFSLCNMTEVVLASTLMFPAIAAAPDLTVLRQLRSLLLYGVLLAPAVASLMASLFLRLSTGAPIVQSMRHWFAAEFLGVATVTPIYLSQYHRRRFSPRRWPEVTGLFALLVLVSVVCFRFNTPTLWLVAYVLLLLGMRLGLTGSACGLLVVTFIGGFLTVKGSGPIRPGLHGMLTTRILFFQSFIALSMLALYLTEVSMAAGRRVRRRLESSEIRFRSLAEASRDVILLVDLKGRRQYVSPAMQELLGWQPDELVGFTFGEIAHPRDHTKLQRLLDELRAGIEPKPLPYRCRKKDGSYQWMEATARLLRDDHTQEPTSFVCVLRDIADRKAAEDKLKEAFDRAEALAMMDGLTGVANRRLLDQTLNQEWLRGTRERTPLSVLLIDVDHFKTYNDLYGHLEGDACLRRIAAETQSVLRRPPDLLARYGGEEFVAILPNTDADGAEVVSELIRQTIEACAIPHRGNPHAVVTVSLGCATAIPTGDASLSSLLKAADQALYRAKSGGRNQACAAGDDLLVN